MDIADRADQLIEIDRAEGVRRVQAAVTGAGASECIDCGDAIEPGRRAAMPAANRCTCCQRAAERAAHATAVSVRRPGAFLAVLKDLEP